MNQIIRPLYLQRKLELQIIKSISIVDFLKSMGFTPKKVSSGKAWYLSPLRIERTASFVVYLERNDWYDFGINKGGSIIDLVIELFDMPYSEAVQMLRIKASATAANMDG